MKKWVVLFVLYVTKINAFSPTKVYEPIYAQINTNIFSSGILNTQNYNSKNIINYGFGINLEWFIGDIVTSNSSLKYGFNFTNLGYTLQKDKLNQNYELSYLSTNVSYKRLLFESRFYVIGGVNLNYLYDVESEIETLNSNNEMVVINRDLSGFEISNNYNRFDFVGSIGCGYEIYMERYYISIEPKYNFSFFNHINENNQDLKGMNIKNEFWSLNFGLSFPLFFIRVENYGNF